MVFAPISPNATEPEPQTTNLCPCCRGRMVIIERFERGATPRLLPSVVRPLWPLEGLTVLSEVSCPHDDPPPNGNRD
jgi:hypothetical protein